MCLWWQMRNDILRRDTAYRKALVPASRWWDTSCGIARAKYRGMALKLPRNCAIVETRITERIRFSTGAEETVEDVDVRFLRTCRRGFCMRLVFRAKALSLGLGDTLNFNADWRTISRVHFAEALFRWFYFSPGLRSRFAKLLHDM